jgi:hypothetical protein
MTRILSLILAVAGFGLTSCECCKSKKAASCCDSGSGASCCAEPGKAGGHQH